jgi:hypothetical protein
VRTIDGRVWGGGGGGWDWKTPGEQPLMFALPQDCALAALLRHLKTLGSTATWRIRCCAVVPVTSIIPSERGWLLMLSVANCLSRSLPPMLHLQSSLGTVTHLTYGVLCFVHIEVRVSASRVTLKLSSCDCSHCQSGTCAKGLRQALGCERWCVSS